MNAVFQQFAAELVARNDGHLCDYIPEEQTARVVEALERFHAYCPLAPAPDGLMVDLAGFGEAPVRFIGSEHRYFLISELGAALGVPVWKACDWARREYLHAIEDQRDMDEKRGDGKLGWELLDDHCDLRLWCVTENPEAKPDAGGRRWSDYGDWLISDDRLLSFIADSPWGKEFMTNMQDLFAIGMKRFMSGPLKEVPVVDLGGDGTVRSASVEDLFHTDLSEAEAREKARRGPNIPMDEDE